MTGYGLYEWRAADVTAVDSPWVINGTGGRYHSLIRTIKGANSGLATLSSGGRVTQLPANAIVGTFPLSSTSVGGGSATSYTDTHATHSISVTGVQSGDLIEFVWTMDVNTGADAGDIKLTDTNAQLDSTNVLELLASNKIRVAFAGLFTPSTTGTIVIKSQYKMDTAVATSVFAVSGYAKLIRP